MELSSDETSPHIHAPETNSISSADLSYKNVAVGVKPGSFKTALESFDQTFDTIIDYFAIIGFDESQLRDVISEIQKEPEIPKPTTVKRPSTSKLSSDDMR
jgi:hypothetical protein